MSAASDIGQDMVGAVRGVLGLSRRGRLREQVSELTDLHMKMAECGELDTAREHLVRAIEHQAEALAQSVDPEKRRPINWGPGLLAVLFFVVPTALLTYWGYQYTHAWWGWLWTVITGLACLFLAIASVYVFVSRDAD